MLKKKKKRERKEENEVPDQISEENKRKISSRSKIGIKQKKKIPKQRLEESKKERKIPDQRSEESKRKIQKGLWTGQYLNNTELSQPNEKRKETTLGSGPLPLIANQNLVCQ